MAEEDRISDLVGALADVQARLMMKASELSARGWRQVTYALVPVRLRGGDAERVGWQGHADGEKQSVGPLAWELDITRLGRGGWEIERSLIYGSGESRECVAELPTVELQTSAELASELPGLCIELLALEASGLST